MNNDSLLYRVDITVTNLKVKSIPNIVGLFYPLIASKDIRDVIPCAKTIQIIYGEMKEKIIDFSKSKEGDNGLFIHSEVGDAVYSPQTNGLKLAYADGNLKVGYTLRFSSIVSLYRPDGSILDKTDFDNFTTALNNPSSVILRQSIVL